MLKNISDFRNELLKKFSHRPTSRQAKLFEMLVDFIFSKDYQTLFLLKGYAGTGKTSAISALVLNLNKTNKKAVLLAPTGRAAKVISGYSKVPAYTIHKKIYFPKKQQNGSVDFVLKTNKHRNTIFIVDEASMIPDRPQNGKLF